MKRTLKTAIIAIVLLASLLVSLFALTACNDVASNYVSAKEAWDSAANKMSTDSGTLTATVGTGDAALHLNLDLTGRRVYIGDTFSIRYEVTVVVPDADKIQTEDSTLDIANMLKEGIGITLTAEKGADGVIDFSLRGSGLLAMVLNLSSSFTEEDMHTTIPVLDLAANTFYDPEGMSANGEEYVIPGDSSLRWILDQVAPILAYGAGYDIMPMIYDWVDFGDVTGTVTFDDGNFSTMTTSQDISGFMPIEDALFLVYNLEFFPMTLKQLFDDKMVSFTVLGSTLTLDLREVITDGIRIEGNVSTAAEYTILPDDATMESVLG